MSETWSQRIDRYIAEGRTVSGGKGDDEIKAQERMQLGFNNQLKSIFATQFGQQSGILNFLNQKLTGQVANPTGLSPTAEAAMRTSATEQAARDFAHAQTATQAGEAARGGSTLPSGVDAQLRAENANAAAAENTTAQTGITMEDQQLKQQNYWNAVSGLSGVAGQENPNAYAGEFNSGSGTVGSLGGAYQSTQQSPVLGVLGGIAGGAATAGFNKLFKG